MPAFAGAGNYFAVDPVIIQVLWLLVVVLAGVFPGVIICLLFMFVIPEKTAKHKTGGQGYHIHDTAPLTARWFITESKQ
ncbi:MAG: hypothetical protein A3C80_03730 [Candidatus Ryanbacteria bacterium RIFCSPHIGHO2_02_FULL_45_43]|uniref:Uncharacterized protein n=1 Tax=Candidatus Ryanbacteria bacterium RIFCSPHIGHO2_01_45_13 TaxID=1802112 RepID=A0A1G2FZW6_9BACT|nr:MAG: hypothetical protein A2718_02990 [Candidatus Ryanbacteria bacterium RIFCSPHIGHO2_01_FULL_44_130]OGZ43138.1 MAG: hypothetical protein A2W41_00385 [Candidatus Ryanbacteria bacterium RIFCSPHIGHO2_01_45_13]OGZ47787.1 MAG: hypothetical protein A3C80_03730 [Candidatus Ryanbacteria bacterium RIFCSPHIGHO2_02_FULL_45_43]OGZ49680.1 MAG: hypothetical protein A3E55_02185 [Candidatus Ryanbacteria bacterium RIFCSPHIGHO2_12_FULL_44_20]OGZ52173.1 MAG: hypothetical protein A3A17_03050 [Candidatus Ryanba